IESCQTLPRSNAHRRGTANSVRVGAYDLAAGPGAEGSPGDLADGVLDEVDRAIGEADVHAVCVVAPRGGVGRDDPRVAAIELLDVRDERVRIKTDLGDRPEVLEPAVGDARGEGRAGRDGGLEREPGARHDVDLVEVVGRVGGGRIRVVPT